jgi:hypothetical protein
LRWLDIRATLATATLIVVIVVVINGRLWMAIHVCSPPEVVLASGGFILSAAQPSWQAPIWGYGRLGFSEIVLVASLALVSPSRRRGQPVRVGRRQGVGMQLIDEIIELAVDDKTSLPVLLRKCLVLSHRLKNERLKAWAEKELDGYANDDLLPDYRQTYTISKGLFLGPAGASIQDQPIPTALLKEEHQAIVENATFRSPIAAYQIDSKDKSRDGRWIIPWPPNLVVMYQTAFFKHLALNRAWMEVPSNFIAALLDTVRNRVLKFALELQEELGSVSDDPAALSPERVDRSVVNIIYGGHNVIAGRVEDVTQAGSILVLKGDVTTLANALKQLGADSSDVQTLRSAIAEDATAAPASPGLGHRTLGWIRDAAIKLASKGGNAALDVAKAQMTAELTRLVSQFLGLT